MGAWIEIKIDDYELQRKQYVAPFMGAWIEILKLTFACSSLFAVAPFMGAWIEIYKEDLIINIRMDKSRPSWARGLKFFS